MSKIMKIAAVTALVMAFVVAGAATASASFDRDLTVGSTGADVAALQSALGMVLPTGVTPGYFGTLTKNAVIKFQTDNKITPAFGYVGPITRGVLNGITTTTTTTTTTTSGVPGCAAGAAFSATTGASCAASTVTGCAAGALFSATTGASCSGAVTTTTTSNNNAEGSFTVKLAANPSTRTNITDTNDVAMIGFDIKAKDSDIRIDRVNIAVAVAAGATNLSPSSFVKTFSLMNGSTVLKTINATDLEKDSGVYHVQISGLGMVVSKDTTKTLTIIADVNSISGGDSAKAVTVRNYGTQAFRGVDGAGLDEYNSEADGAFSRTQTFGVSGASTLTASDDTSKPDSTNVKLDTTDGAKDVVVDSFRVKSTTGASTITDVRLAASGSNIPSSVYLYNGSELLGSLNGSTTMSFEDLTVDVSKDAYKTLTVKADYSATTTAVTNSTISLAATGVSYDKPDGTSGVTTNSKIDSNVVTLVNAATPVFTLVGTPTISDTVNTDTSSTTRMQGSITFHATAAGDTLTRSSIAVAGKWATSSTATGIAATINLQITPTTDVNDGAYATVVAQSTLNASSVPASAYLGFYLTSLTAEVGGNTVTQTTGLDDYHTTNLYFQK